jgi:2-succinyl-5-enolpyruvyl-6-hydroxy-3-cyclohexene-1-carboxylate synthase
MTAAAESLNLQWANLIIEELSRCGVHTCSMSSGSRSSPLVAALARHESVESVVHYDERGSAFYALGRARALGQPCAWLTTSGTAVANGLPAVIEAANANVPLLLLTADRPPELRDAGANQTIDQVKLFGDYVRWFVDVPCPSPDIAADFILTTIDQAVHRARTAPAGPVHINMMFREPLLAGHDGAQTTVALPDRWGDADRPYTLYDESRPAVSAEAIRDVTAAMAKARRGVLVIGQLDVEVEAYAVGSLVSKLAWPVLADVTSGLRLRDGSPYNIAYYDLILLSETYASTLAPDLVLHLGGRCTSKRLQQFLARSRPDVYYRVKASPEREDPSHIVTDRLQCDLYHFCDSVCRHLSDSQSDMGIQKWQSVQPRIDDIIDSTLAENEAISEPGLARAVSRLIPEGHLLYLGSSMPIRDMDMFGVPDGTSLRVLANRGASGIDGCIATAVGVADETAQPLTAIVGDIACLHDLNSLALLNRAPVTLIVVNNDGGGIFSFLPIAEFEDIFESHFGTPHGLHFEHAASMFGISYHRPSGHLKFEEVYYEAVQSRESALIEVNTDRQDNAKIHRKIEDAIREHLESVYRSGS